jgi:hypothetical protein
MQPLLRPSEQRRCVGNATNPQYAAPNMSVEQEYRSIRQMISGFAAVHDESKAHDACETHPCSLKLRIGRIIILPCSVHMTVVQTLHISMASGFRKLACLLDGGPFRPTFPGYKRAGYNVHICDALPQPTAAGRGLQSRRSLHIRALPLLSFDPSCSTRTRTA